MCSGGYLGKLTYLVIKTACEEHIFSPAFAEYFMQLTNLNAADIDLFLDDPDNAETVLGAVVAQGNLMDSKKLKDILATIIKRTSSIVAAVLAATIIKSGKGKNERAFELSYLQVKPFYFDYIKNTQMLSSQSQKYLYYVGLYLLFLLSNNRTTDFSTELELLDIKDKNNQYIYNMNLLLYYNQA